MLYKRPSSTKVNWHIHICVIGRGKTLGCHYCSFFFFIFTLLRTSSLNTSNGGKKKRSHGIFCLARALQCFFFFPVFSLKLRLACFHLFSTFIFLFFFIGLHVFDQWCSSLFNCLLFLWLNVCFIYVSGSSGFYLPSFESSYVCACVFLCFSSFSFFNLVPSIVFGNTQGSGLPSEFLWTF